MTIKNEILLTEKQINQLYQQVSRRHNVRNHEDLEEFMNSLDCLVRLNPDANEIKFIPRKENVGCFIIDIK